MPDLDQINITVTDIIPPDNFATVDAGAKVGTVYTKEQDNAWRKEVETSTQSGIKGVAKPDTPYDPVTNPIPTPWTVGSPNLYEKYDVNEAGAFPNFIKINDQPVEVTSQELQLNEVQIWVKNGVAEIVKKALPQASPNIRIWEDLPSGFVLNKKEQVIKDNVQYIVKDGTTVTIADVPGVSSKLISLGTTKEFNDNRYLISSDYIGPQFQNTLPEPSNSSSSQSFILNVKAQHSGVIPRMQVGTTGVGVLKFQVVKKITNNYPNPTTGNQESFIGADKFSINVTSSGSNIYNVEGDLPHIEKGDLVAWIFEAGDTIQPRIGGLDSLPAYGRWGGGKIGYFDTTTTMSFSDIAGVAMAFEIDYNDLITKQDVNIITSKTNILTIGNKAVSNNLFDKSKVIPNGYVVATTGNVSNSANYHYIRFIPCDPSTNYIKSNTQQIAFFDINKVYISGIATTTGGKFTTPANCFFHSVTVENALVNTFIINKGSALKDYDTYAEDVVIGNKIKAENIIGDVGKEIETVRITLTKNSDDYNSLRNLISSITDASYYKRYVIFVPNGIWFESDLQGKKYVLAIGQSRENTIILCDGNSTNPIHITPADYSYPAEANKQIATVPLTNKHVFFAKNNIDIKNLTVKAIGCKYPLHLDAVGWESVKVENCRIVADNCSYVVGIGIRAGQSIVVYNSILERVESNTSCGIFIHNTTAQNAGSFIEFDRCKFVNCDYVLVDELGSNQVDDWRFTNCFASTASKGRFEFMVDKGGDNKTFWTNPETGIKESDPKNVPYNIMLNTTGTKITELRIRPASSFNVAYTWGQRDLSKLMDLSIIDYTV
ncbi:hypothetical protein [Chryseobacterium indoltheticum]|uniref:Uncharacterized protein n=1 Tax=Chryseobacterium indoltheticum TaxID=254 RepID=A0A3G6MYF1_9FLAO|nr:hypothetical protein [Chryseobacterium indoltheticum]AZA60772.1 hypothetical protein EG340_06840 [Chryseobacterium indoltheticum]